MPVALHTALLAEPAPGRVRAAHDLVREVVLTDLDPARRSALHRAWAQALAAGPAAATSAAAIAMHHCVAAAEVAVGGLRHVPEHEPGLRTDLHEVRGTALRRLGRLEESSAELRAAAELARRHDDPRRLARAALASAGGGVGGYWACIGAPAATDVPLLDEAVSRAGDLPPMLRSAVLAALAVQRASAGYDDGLGLASAATRAIGGPDAGGAAEHAGAAVSGDADAGPAAREPAAAPARGAVAEFVTRWTPARAAERVGLARAMLAASGADHTHRATAVRVGAVRATGGDAAQDSSIPTLNARNLPIRRLEEPSRRPSRLVDLVVAHPRRDLVCFVDAVAAAGVEHLEVPPQRLHQVDRAIEAARA